MANRIFGEARLPLADGRELTLRFDYGALCEAEEAADKRTPALMKELATGAASLKTARAMLYGGLRFYHPEVTLEDVGDILLIDGDRAQEAMSSAFGEMADRKTAAQNPRHGVVAAVKTKPPRGIGTRSSKSGAKAA